jgi:hypothetical protein
MNNQYPTKDEQIVQQTISGLRQLEDIFPYEFAETIATIERLYFLRQPSVLTSPLTGEQLRTTNVCPRHQVGLLQASYKDVDADMVCPKCEVELMEVA